MFSKDSDVFVMPLPADPPLPYRGLQIGTRVKFGKMVSEDPDGYPDGWEVLEGKTGTVTRIFSEMSGAVTVGVLTDEELPQELQDVSEPGLDPRLVFCGVEELIKL
jgi:hypothetical protein